MRIDLHTHSSVSDGTQTPTELVYAARAAGLDVMALTDHDTAAGWSEAQAAADHTGITLVRGMEISTKWEHQGVHLLAYLPDPTFGPLVDGLRKVLDGRDDRVPAILEKLREHGVGLTEADVAAQSRNAAATGRPHIADAMVAAGVVRDRDQAFEEWLSPGRPAYVPRYAAPLVEMIATVREAGGVCVVAHPWGRGRRGRMTAEGLALLQEAGLSGVEVDHQDHDAATRAELRAVARELGLVVTGSSDHHGLGKTGHDLGCNTTAPEEYERLLDLAATAAAASGRTTPEVTPA